MNIYLKLIPVALCVVGATVWHLDGSRVIEPPVAPEVDPVKTRFAFPNFPVGNACRIDLEADEGTFGLLTVREQEDQRLDWLLFGIVGDSGMPADEINRALYDVPPVRHGYLRPVARFEYGVTRSCCLGEGEIIALVPDDDTEEKRRDHLAHIADEHRKNLGRAPARLHVFTYKLAPGGITVKHADPIPGDALFSAAQGYREVLVADLAGLEAFLKQTDDLVYVKVESNGLRLGGRTQLPTPGRRKLMAVDLAALWQAEHAIQQANTAFTKEWETRKADWEQKWKQRWDEVERKWKLQHTSQGQHSSGGWIHSPGGMNANDPLRKDLDETDSISADDLLKKYLSDHGKYKPVFPSQKTPQEMLSPTPSDYDPILAASTPEEMQQKFSAAEAVAWEKFESDCATAEEDAHLLDGTGFSLDPQLDFEAFVNAISSPAFEADIKSSGILQQWPQFESEFQKAMAPVKVQAEQVRAGNAGWELDRKKAVTPLFEFLNRLKHSDNKIAQAIEETLAARHAFYTNYQTARYEGPLEGTEVGMTLFYTDLLAKLWAMDYSDQRAPGDRITDFVPLTAVAVSPVYREEIRKLNFARLWFGPEDNGFQIDVDKSLRFAPNATRLYAASHETLTPGQEKAPSPEFEAFLGWWNDHYEEVARFEPEYLRLNDIMKWSVVIRWLTEQGNNDRLRFLSDLKPTHAAWFPEWAKQTHPSSTRLWEQSFKIKGFKGTRTEAMPRLCSDTYRSIIFDADRKLRGGISLASEETLQKHLPLSENLPLALRRAELDLSKTNGPSGTLTNLRETTYRLSHIEPTRESTSRLTDRASLSIDGGGKDPRYRARYGELANGHFERTIARDAGHLQVEVQATGRKGAVEIGVLESTPLPAKNGLRIGWRSRSLDSGFSLGRRLSAGGPDLSLTLKRDATVERAVQLGDDYYVKQLGSRQWLKISKQQKPGDHVMDGWDAQLADVSPDAQTLNLAWLDEKLLDNVLQNGNQIRGPPPGHTVPGGITGGPDGILPPGGSFEDGARRIIAGVDGRRQQVDAEWHATLPQIDELLAADEQTTARRMVGEMLEEYGPRPELVKRSELLAALKDIDTKLADQKFDEARQAVDAALAMWPQSEGLLIRKALVAINAGRKADAAAAAAAIDAVPPAASEAFLRELTGRVRLAKDQTEFNEWKEIASLVDHRRYLARAHPDDTLRISYEDGRMVGTLRVAGTPGLETVQGQTLSRDFYYDSSFANLDVNGVPGGVVLDQLPSQGEVKRLPREDIAHFRPWKVSIHVKLSDESYKEFTFTQPRSQTAPSQSSAETWYRYRAVYYPWTGTASPNANDDDEKKKKRAAEMGLQGPREQADADQKAVYLVLAPVDPAAVAAPSSPAVRADDR